MKLKDMIARYGKPLTQEKLEKLKKRERNRVWDGRKFIYRKHEV